MVQMSKATDIDFLSLLIVFWKNKFLILKTTLISMSIGVLISLVIPKKYTVETVMVPQISNSQDLGKFSSLVAIAGINLNSFDNSNLLTPIVYPRILSSLPLQKELLDSKIFYNETRDSITIFEYYLKNSQTFLRKLFSSKKHNYSADESIKLTQNTEGIYISSRKYENIRKLLNNEIQLNLKDKEGILIMQVTMKDPYVAAQVANRAQRLLQKYITQYKIEKAQEQYNFCLQRLKEKKSEFESIQKELAFFRDRNININTATAKIQEDELQSKYNILYSVYMELSKQAEQLQLKVKEDTPILTIIEPIKVPTQKSKPDRVLIIVIFILLGIITGLFTVLIKEYNLNLKAYSS